MLLNIKSVFIEKNNALQWEGSKYFEQCRILLAVVTEIRTECSNSNWVTDTLRTTSQYHATLHLLLSCVWWKAKDVLEFKQIPTPMTWLGALVSSFGPRDFQTCRKGKDTLKVDLEWIVSLSPSKIRKCKALWWKMALLLAHNQRKGTGIQRRLWWEIC